MAKIPNCPQCNSEYVYEDGILYVCPECAHEWPIASSADQDEVQENIIRDANGNELKDGDDVIVIRDLKVRGASNPIKQGTKVRNITLVHNPSDGHDIDCRIDGFGAMKLKSEVVKKA